MPSDEAHPDLQKLLSNFGSHHTVSLDITEPPYLNSTFPIIGSAVSSYLLRNPFQRRVINVRPSVNEEVYQSSFFIALHCSLPLTHQLSQIGAVLEFLVNKLGLSRIALFHEGTEDSLQVNHSPSRH